MVEPLPPQPEQGDSSTATSDQDIDTAGTEADDERRSRRSAIERSQDRSAEVPGDTDAADIVGRTGEEMPSQSHDGLDGDANDRRPKAEG